MTKCQLVSTSDLPRNVKSKPLHEIKSKLDDSIYESVGLDGYAIADLDSPEVFFMSREDFLKHYREVDNNA